MSDKSDYDVYNPNFWKKRVSEAIARDRLHEAVFFASEGQFLEHTVGKRDFLIRTIRKTETVLEIGCGYGRFHDLYPEYRGRYLGIDISPDLIEQARIRHPDQTFMVADMQTFDASKYDWVVAMGVRNMVRNFISEKAWENIEEKYRKVCTKGMLITSLPLVEPPFILSPL